MSYGGKGYGSGWDLLRISDALSAPDPVVDLDPNRTVTYLENETPHCYLGHPECYDAHSSERRSDEVDFELE